MESNKSGISDSERAKKIITFGYNRITAKKSIPWIVKLMINMFGGFQLFLWIGGVLCVIVYIITDFLDYQTLALGILCFIVVIGTSLFQTYQEGKSDDVMAALKALTPDKVLVLINGEEVEKESINLVPGDIIHVKKGEKVPADVRVLDSDKLKVNNASLTGENVDINLHGNEETSRIYEAKNIARMGCNFTNGSGRCIVFSTGDDTFFGHIAKSTLNIKRPDSCLTKEIKRLVHIMGAIAITIGIIFLILALVRGYKAVEAVVFMIGIIVANVPEGLLPQMTVALTLTAKKMQKKGVIVTNLEIIETLGAVSVICSDKTGTLTCNRMTVSHLAYDGRVFGVGIGQSKKSPDHNENDKMADEKFDDHEKLFDCNSPSFKELQKVMTINTNAKFEPGQEKVPVLNRNVKDGDASEAALVKFVEPIRSIDEYRKCYRTVHEIPFNSSNKWMLKIVQSLENPGENDGKYTLLLKGAPEKVLNFCTYYLHEGKIKKIEPTDYERIIKLNEDLANKGERVLGFASKISEDHFDKDFIFAEDAPFNFKHNTGYVFTGLASLLDPPRDNVFDSINKCREAGIQVFMVTGDQPLTALSIAKKLRLVTDEDDGKIPEEGKEKKKSYIVVNGVELLNFKQEDWDKILEYKEIVFARTMPQQKQDIVNQLKAKNKIVAMTGDGVNDAPALKAAHVGIAMGSGASVAKEAGQLILVNDDFANIVDGVQEGRLIFENLKKCICYVLASNVPELIPFLLFIILKIPLSIETIMIILIDVGTDLAPAIALAWEPEEDQTMKLPPRSNDSHLVGFKLMFVSYLFIGIPMTFGAYFSWAWVYYDYGFTINDLIGSGVGYRDHFKDNTDELKIFFKNMCLNNKIYQNTMVTIGKNCEQDFKDHLVYLLGVSQTAFLMTIVWCQIILIFIRKTQSESILSWKRLTNNVPLYWSLLMEMIVIIVVVYVPGLNEALLLVHCPPVFACTALWMLPVLLIMEELRKYFIRISPNGCVASWTKF